jgi:hypothetical protein
MMLTHSHVRSAVDVGTHVPIELVEDLRQGASTTLIDRAGAFEERGVERIGRLGESGGAGARA